MADDGRQKTTGNSPPNKQQQNKFAKWSSNSKFNRILNNIERSILAQFNSNSSDHQHYQHNCDNNCGKGRRQPSTSSSFCQQPASGTQVPTKTKAILATKSANRQTSNPSLATHDDAKHPSQLMDRVTSELKLKEGSNKELVTTANCHPMPANRNGKMTLNKYQQQIVSAIQTNKNRPTTAKPSYGSSYSHNRLSIPPPHANDEARNQNHRLLFGCPRTQPSDINSTTDQMATIYNHGRITAAIKENDQQPQLFYRSSASPASSAQSLPVTKPGFSQAPQNRSQIKATGDEESGFCTYQSRRSALNIPPSSTNRIPDEFFKPENDMMFMRTDQMPLGTLTSQQHHQIIHSNNLLQSRLTQQQSSNNTQRQQINEVPISQGVMYNDNLHIQHQVNLQQLQNPNRPSDTRNQTYGSYGQFGPVAVSQPAIQQQYQTQTLYDGQIYANAPPKPRRYQYYDSGLNINPSSTASTRALQNYPPQLTTLFNGQQVVGLPVRQFPYGISNEQATQTFNQRHGQLMNAGGIHIPYRPQRQRPVLPPPPPSTLTKSKSSLDVADLARFKQDRIQADGILRVQPQVSNVPIYGSTRLINQIESSTLQRNPNYHPPITINYQQQQQHSPTNLQRSRSIGNLLPDYNTHELNMAQRQLAQSSAENQMQRQRSNAPIYPKFLTVSSASTNNLNNLGLVNDNTTMSLNNSRQAIQIMQQIARHNSNVNNAIQKQQKQLLALQNAPLPPMRQNYQRQANDGGWLNQQRSTIHNNGVGDTAKTNTNTISNSGKVVRQPQSSNTHFNGVPPAEGSSSVGQSLDDKIRHLLIGDDSAVNNSSDKTESSREATAWPIQQQSHLQIFRQTQSSQKETGTHSVPARGTSESFADRRQDGEISTENDEQLARGQNYHSDATLVSMGNRHQRQYQVGEALDGASNQQMRFNHRSSSNHCDGMSVNSQLIVDLTTPRVLAKTQTTLLPTMSQADQSSRVQQSRQQGVGSMNQLGLPTKFVGQSILNYQADTTNHEQNLEFKDKVDSTDVGNISAPYYYSDLKSEEQRRALFNIVQQKSLSPPPQLLSRSIDQSNTRLAPKSATMHASQARLMSETLAASQRRLQSNAVFADNKSTNNLPGVSSNSSVAKNIDKLFESPVDPQLIEPVNNKLQSVQSMLTLSTELASESAISRVPANQNQIESLSNSSGYCNDAWKRAGSKSKSLENISQQMQSDKAGASIDKSTIEEKLRRYGNPVYENIRRSDKLLSAINNSTTCLSTSSTRNRKTRSSLPPRPQPTSGSDSMDSILGSSFDDDDDDDESEENPEDVDSDNSTLGIDFIKLSPTTADMSELIEQLRNNHAKLTDEYKSTLSRISKILNRKDSSGKRKVGDKLAGKLQRLEQKSKKCESRSKNQLALIQMMEKAFRQTKAEPDKSPVPEANRLSEIGKSPLASDPNKIPDCSVSTNSPQNSISPKQTSLSCENTSPCDSIDYQNLKPSKTQSASEKPSLPSTASQLQSPPPPPPPPPAFEAQNVIRAIVTEATSTEVPKKFVAELCGQAKPKRDSITVTTEPVSLSTRHQQVKRQDWRILGDSRANSNGTVGRRVQSIESNTEHNGKNPFHDKPENKSPIGPLDDYKTEAKRKNSGAFHELGDDEDDFIEFLSTGSSSTHGRSQFESSQFSASDFNNSSSSGSTSESSHSGSATTDSLDLSSPPSKTQSSDGSVKDAKISKSGFKNSRHDDKSRKKGNRSNNNNNNNNNDTGIHKISNNKDDKMSGDNKFKNVLGNVIDVDVYPVNTNPPTS